MLQDLWAGRELAWRLAVRDISAQYRQSALGILWALINPLTTTAVWLFLSTSQLEALVNTLLDFQGPADLAAWLTANVAPASEA